MIFATITAQKAYPPLWFVSVHGDQSSIDVFLMIGFLLQRCFFALFLLGIFGWSYPTTAQSDPFFADSMQLVNTKKLLAQYEGRHLDSTRHFAGRIDQLLRKYPEKWAEERVANYLVWAEHHLWPDSALHYIALAETIMQRHAIPATSPLFHRITFARGIYLFNHGDFPLAKQAFAGFLGHADTTSDTDWDLRYLSLHHLGRIYHQKGSFDEALAWYDRAQNLLSPSRPYQFFLGHHHFYKALCLLDMNETKRALAALQHASEIFEFLQDDLWLDKTILATLRYYRQVDRLSEALLFVDQQLNDHEERFPGHVTLMLEKGELLTGQQQYDSAQQVFLQVATILQQSPHPYQYQKGRLHQLQARLQFKQQRYHEAQQSCQLALAQYNFPNEKNAEEQYMSASVAGLPQAAIFQTLQLKAAALHSAYQRDNAQLGLLQEALATYKKASRLIPTLITADYQSGRMKPWAETYRSFYDDAIMVAYLLDSLHRFSGKYVEPALQLIEQSKATTRLNRLLENNTAQWESLPPELAAMSNQYRRALIYYRDLWSSFTAETSPQQLAHWAAGWQKAQAAYADHLRVLSQAHPHFYNKRMAQPDISLPRIRSITSAEQRTLLLFFMGADHYYTITFDDDRYQFLRVSKRKNFDNNLRAILAFDTLPFFTQKQMITYQALSHQMYRDLMGPLAIHRRKITVIPDGALAHLPFEALVVNLAEHDHSPLHYLVFDKTINYAYSLAVLQANHDLPHFDTRSVIAFAPGNYDQFGMVPLKGVPGHLRFLERQFNCKRVADEKANILSFTDQWMRMPHNIVVLAAHATAGPAPKIYFHDTTFHQQQWYAHHMQANLMVLTANKNTSWQFETDESVMCQAEGPTIAGIPATISTMWSVHHRATINVLENFYLHLASGKNKDEALGQAKVDYLKSCHQDGYLSAPHFWAGIVLMGQTEPLYTKSYLLPIAIFLLLVGFAWAWKRHQQEIK